MLIEMQKNGIIKMIDRDSWIDIKWKDASTSDFEAPDRFESLNNIEISVSNNKVNHIALPAYYRGELLYVKFQDYIYLSDDLFVIAQKIGKLTFEVEQKEYFLKKGYLPVGKTMFSEIKRLISNCIYTMEDGNFVPRRITFSSDSLYLDDRQAYEKFKDSLRYSVNKHISHGKNGILLSGGVDSRLLLMLLLEKNKDVKIISSSSYPYFLSNCQDVILAERVAKTVGCEINVDTVDYTNLSLKDLEPIIRLMPLCVHTGINFVKMFQMTKKYGDLTVFCGQNMDSLYNLGPTERTAFNFHGIAQWFKRFYLSEEYFRTLPDVSGKGSSLSTLIAEIGKQLFRKTTHIPSLNLPRTGSELISNFANSSDYTVFSNSDDNHSFYDSDTIKDPFEIKKELYHSKLSYLKGGDSQAVEVGAYLSGLRVSLPYSDPKMVAFFSELHLTKKDVWKPKRYSYKFLNEFVHQYGKEIVDFASPTTEELRSRFGEVRDLYDVFEEILSVTQFGKDLSIKAGIEPKGYTGLMKYSSLVRAYWLNRVVEILEGEYGVSIE